MAAYTRTATYDLEVTSVTTSRRTAAIIAVTVISALALALPACGGGSSAKGGTTIKAPVLWAGPGSNGQIDSGVENATVTVANVGSPGFTIDLASVKAKSAGPQWLAATTSAAAVATLLSGGDPAKVDISFTITGQIDGPSGGAMLTVASLAAIRNLKLADKITMTGTISPDGSVGRVGEIPAKLRGAAKAGYKTVLLPMTNLVASGEASTSDMVEFGRTLGLDVRGVTDIAQAFTTFTGETIFAPAPPAPAPSAKTEATVRAQTSRLLERIRSEVTPTTNPAITNELAQANAAFSAGDLATAYGLGVDTYTLLTRENATRAINEVISTRGNQEAREVLKQQAAELEALSSATLKSATNVAGLDAVAQLTLPFSLGWITWADAILEGTLNGLTTGSITFTSYEVTAAAIAEQRAAIEVFSPDALELVRTTSNPSITTVVPPPEFLSNYTNFLIEAGNANKEYLAVVVGSKSTTDTSGAPIFTALGLNALAATVAATPPETQSVEEEIEQSAVAVSYFVLGTGLVSNTGANGILGSGVGADTRSTVTLPGLINAVILADSGVKALVDLLAERSIDPAYPRWSSSWGFAAATALNGSGRDSAGEYLALNELWYDGINCSVLYAATAPS